MKIFSCILLFISLTLFAQEKIKIEIDQILGTEIDNPGFSVFVYDPLTLDTLYAKNISKPLIPASNTKLYTTATALHLLTPTYALNTKILTDDENFSDSTINGKVFIKGFGDALLTEEELDSAALVIAERGITKIDGDIIGDESYFDRVYTRDDWIKDERANVPLPPISGLSLDRNKIVIKFFRNGSVGDLPGYKMFPSGYFYNLDMNAKLTKFRSRPRIQVRTNDDELRVTVGGGIQRRNSPYSYLLYPDSPAVFTAMVFKDKLQSHGIEILGKAKSGTASDLSSQLFEIEHDVTRLINKVNKESDNYLAENLFKILGAEYSMKEGNSFYATQAVMTFLDQNGIYSEGTSIVDGSGISRFNQTTTASIVSLLEYIYFDLDRFDFYYNSLSIAGRDGTLDDRLFESAAYENFRGKTGTLYGVSSISGYLSTVNNNDLIISIIMNDKSVGQNKMRSIQDKIISWCAENL